MSVNVLHIMSVNLVHIDKCFPHKINFTCDDNNDDGCDEQNVMSFVLSELRNKFNRPKACYLHDRKCHKLFVLIDSSFKRCRP